MRVAFLLPVLIAVAACGHRGVTVDHAWVRLPAVAGQPGAAYLTIHGGARTATLTRVESAMAERVELHDTMGSDRGMMTMRPLADLAVPAGQTVIFAPGARHMMVYGLDKSVRPGTAIPLRLGFSDGTTAEAEAKSVAAGDPAPY